MNNNEKWTSALVKCNSCGFEWRAVYAKGNKELECSDCGNMVKFHTIEEMSIEALKPQMIRMQPKLKIEIQESANDNNKGNFNKEIRYLIRIGLKNRKIGGEIKQKVLSDNVD